MPRRKTKRLERSFKTVLPLFIVTVCVVFSFLFTVLMVPLGVVESDIKIIFIMLLVTSTTVASTVALIFFLIFNGRL